MIRCNETTCLSDSEQKWSKGKVRDKLNNLVLFDKATYDKLYKEVPNYKLITPAVVSERLKIRGSLARNALQELLAKGDLCLFFMCPKWCTVDQTKYLHPNQMYLFLDLKH